MLALLSIVGILWFAPSFFPFELFSALLFLMLLVSELEKSSLLNRTIYHVLSWISPRSQALQYGSLFVFGFVVSAIGFGNILGMTLLLPVLTLFRDKLHLRWDLSLLLLVLGVNAAALSPVAPTGIVFKELTVLLSIPANVHQAFVTNALGHLGFVVLHFILLLRLSKEPQLINFHPIDMQFPPKESGFSQYAGLVGILMTLILSLGVGLSLGKAAAVGYLLCCIWRKSMKINFTNIHWDILFLVSCMSGLAAFAQSQGFFSFIAEALISSFSGLALVFLLLLLCALGSIIASSSAVILPVFLPLIFSVAGRVDLPATYLILSATFCAHIVDVSPFSTLGALGVSAIQDKTERDHCYRYLILRSMGFAILAAAILTLGLILFF